MIRIAIITGSTRARRRTAVVAKWVKEVAVRHPAVVTGEVTFEGVDLVDHELPMLDEPVPAAFGEYRHPHTKRWSRTIDSFDGFVFVTPEYNHAPPAALKNAIDFLYGEWHHKAAGFVSHGVDGGGVRAVEHLRLTLAETKVASVAGQVALSAFTDFDLPDPAEPGVLTPGEHQELSLREMLDELIAWSGALKPLRAADPQLAQA